MTWDVDKLPIGPGLVKRHGRLDVNLADPRRTDPSLTIPAPHAYTHGSAGGDPVTLAQSQVTGLVGDLAGKLALSLLDAKGDLYVASAADTAARLPVGADGQVLTADSGETLGMKWVTPSGGGGGGGGIVLQVVQNTYGTNTAINSTSWTATGLSRSITPASTSSRILVTVIQNARLYTSGTSDREAGLRLLRDSTVIHTNAAAIVANASGGIAGYVNAGGTIAMSYVDSPATTSSVTYSTEGKVNNSANSCTIDCQYGGDSIIILTELST